MATNSPVADRRRSRDARRQQLPKRFICNVACTVPPPFAVGVALLWNLWCGVMLTMALLIAYRRTGKAKLARNGRSRGASRGRLHDHR